MSRWFNRIAITLIVCWLWQPAAGAETYKLLNGRELVGDPVSYTLDGLVVKRADSTYEQRVPWAQFSQEAIKKLIEDPKAQTFAEAYLEPEPIVKPRPAPLTLRAASRIDRPEKGGGLAAVFSTPVSWFLLVMLYLANLYAAYEISAYRNHHVALVCGLSAVLPFIGPAIFLSLPGQPVVYHEHVETHAPPPEPVGNPLAHAPPPPGQPHVVGTPAPPESALSIAQQAPVAASTTSTAIYQRGQYTFNRRFFETKFPGFFRVVPSEADKHLVLEVKSARGVFTAIRIARISAADMYLLIDRGGATMEEKVPFTEIMEIQVKTKHA